MRWDSPLVLSVAGTLAVHLLLIVASDAIVVYNPPRPPAPAPRIELFEIEVPPVIHAPPPPVVTPPEPAPEPAPAAAPEPPPQRVVRAPSRPQVRSPAPAAATAQPTEPPVASEPQPSGGDQVVTLPDAPPGATGVPVAVGKRTSPRVGRGGRGGGTGSGTGSGAGDAPAPSPVSVATIKQRALPKGDYGYVDARKDYPAEARQLGIEGAIRVRLVVDPEGKVQSAVLLNRLGHGLDELALRRAKEIQFTPALDTDDRPVSSVVVWTFNMTLPD